MPRPMIRTPQTQTQTETNNILSTTMPQQQSQQHQQMSKMQMDRLLRQPRSKEYMEAMKRLDAGGHVHNKQQVDDILDAIRQEFPEIEIAGILLGCVSKCYLGDPYDVHTLDITGNIIEHYTVGNTLPGGLEKARGIALHGGYAFIEVYVDCCRAISENGAVSVISC